MFFEILWSNFYISNWPARCCRLTSFASSTRTEKINYNLGGMTTLCTVLLCINCAKIMELRHSVHVTTWFDWVVFLTWMFKYTVEYNPYWTLTKQYLVFQCLSVKVFFKFKHKNLLINQLYKQWCKLFIFLRQRRTKQTNKDKSTEYIYPSNFKEDNMVLSL